MRSDRSLERHSARREYSPDIPAMKNSLGHASLAKGSRGLHSVRDGRAEYQIVEADS